MKRAALAPVLAAMVLSACGATQKPTAPHSPATPAAKGLERIALIPPQPGATGEPYDQHAWRTVAGPCV